MQKLSSNILKLYKMRQYCLFMLFIYIFYKSDIFVSGQGFSLNAMQYVNYTFGPSYIQINSLNFNYNFRVRRDKSILTSATKVFLHQDKRINRYHLRNTEVLQFYQGYGRKRSKIFGFVKNSTFIGIITMNNEMYFVAPSAQFTKAEYSQNLGILYNIKDLTIYPIYNDDKLICEVRERKESFKTDLINKHKLDSVPKQFMIENHTKKLQRKICSLELVVDHTYSEYMENKGEDVITEILYYMKIADMVFRNIDINGNGATDHIRFIVEKITIFKSGNEPGYPFANISDDHNEFMNKLTTYVHPYCMMICFCHRNFWNENDCAIARVKEIGGICRTGSKQSKAVGSYNVGFVTTLERSTPIILHRIISNLLHQLGHAFGCVDDPITDKDCSPGNSNGGDFIMHPDIPYGSYPNNWKFSSCSIKSMRKFLQNEEITECLKRAVKATCGNGIIEEGEVCDCDISSGNCTHIKKCCILEKSRNQCLLRKKRACYPAPGQCCENCKILKKKIRCFSKIVCFNRSTFCDGLSPFCPEQMEPDGTPCLENNGNCIKGQCQFDICKYYNLTSCECETFDSECHKCCRNKQGKCMTVKELKLFPSEMKIFTKKSGSLCDNDNGVCVSNGTCIRKSIVKTYSNQYSYFLILCFFILLIFAYICYYIIQKRRKKKRFQEIQKNISQ